MKNKNMKILSRILLAVLIVISIAAGSACGGENSSGGPKTVIYVDGGGQSGNYNTDIVSGYDTLEEYAKKWNAANDKYEIRINEFSMNGGRDALVASLSSGTAPDILFQVGTTIAEDLKNNWFVSLTDYMEKANPYVQGNEHWRDLYVAEEYEASKAPDGNIYSAGIDKIINGIIYNKTMFDEAGITKIPETYSEFIKVQKILYEKYKKNDGSYYPYLPHEELYDITLEGAVYANIIGEMDTLRVNNMIDTEELIRAYQKKLYNMDNDGSTYSNMFQNGFLKAVRDKMYYKTVSYAQVSPIDNFLVGNVGMLEAKGHIMLQIKNSSALNYEIGVMPFPVLDTGTYPVRDIDTGEETETSNEYGGKIVRRGSAGIGTGWWITNSARNKGTVDACVDFLMYVSAPENNNKIVGDLGTSIPLNPDENSQIDPLFETLLNYYIQDRNNSETFAWHTCNGSGVMGKEYYDSFLTARKTFLIKDEITDNKIDAYTWMTATLNRAFTNASKTLISYNNYDTSKW